ncbi:MAG: DUF63 family protein [Candidatus Micrarchaeota archaeon]
MRNKTMDFIQEFLLNPLQQPNDYAPYNLVNTLVFAAIALAAAWILYKLLPKLGIKYDEEFFYSVLPFVILGAILRVVVDAEILPRSISVFGIDLFILVTPGIYIFTFVVLMACLLVCLKTKNPMKNFRNAGIILSVIAFLPLLSLYSQIQLDVLLIPVIALAFLAVFDFVWKKTTKTELTNIEKTLFFAQVFDGSATFYGVAFKGYFEQHVVGGAIINSGSPLAFLLIKALFAVGVIYFLRKENKQDAVFITLLITIVGLGPGTRDVLRTLFGV